MTTHERPAPPHHVSPVLWTRMCDLVDELNQIAPVRARLTVTVDVAEVPQIVGEYGDPTAGEEHDL